MTTIKKSWLHTLWTLAFVVTAGLNAQEVSPSPRPASAVSVNDLTAKPGEHLGPVQLVGVVAAVVAGKGFVLVDPRGVRRLRPGRWAAASPFVKARLPRTG